MSSLTRVAALALFGGLLAPRSQIWDVILERLAAKNPEEPAALSAP